MAASTGTQLARGINEVSWIDRREYPFESHFIELSMGRMHYVDEGSGEDLLSNCRVVKYNDAGHFIQEEKGSGLCPVIEDFLVRWP